MIITLLAAGAAAALGALFVSGSGATEQQTKSESAKSPTWSYVMDGGRYLIKKMRTVVPLVCNWIRDHKPLVRAVLKACLRTAWSGIRVRMQRGGLGRVLAAGGDELLAAL